MEELTFLEKLTVLYENIIDHPLFILLFFVPIILLFLQKKHGKKIFIIAYFLVIFSLLIRFGDIIFKLFDNLMDGLFMFLYFPNFITLFLVVVVCSLIALISLLSRKINKVSKIINYISFGIVQSLFSLILITVKVNKINIYKDNALYTNKDVLTLMQFLIGTFSVQILSIIIIKLINKATNVLDNKANISSDVKEEINNLSKTKIKAVNIDNNKVGYINVADKSLTSMPKLKPFKFDIGKIESVQFSDYLFPSKSYSTFELDNKDVSYYNEIIPKKLFNKVNVNSNMNFNIDVPNSLYKSFKLSNRDFYYLNEVIKKRKLKPIILDSNKFVYLKLINRGFKKIILENKNAFYLNEVIKKRKLKPILLDSNKLISLSVPKKSFKSFTLGNRLFSYLNGDVSNKKYSNVDLDLNKDALINVPKKDYNKISLKDKTFGYLNEVVNSKIKPVKFDNNKVYNVFNEDSEFKFDENLFKKKNKPFNYTKESKISDISPKPSEFDNMFNSKPDLLESKRDIIPPIMTLPKANREVIPPIMTLPKIKREVPNNRLIDNLQIIDIQSTLDTIVKCHLMKNVSLKSYERMSINNLEICNFKLLSDIIKEYKIVRK